MRLPGPHRSIHENRSRLDALDSRRSAAFVTGVMQPAAKAALTSPDQGWWRPTCAGWAGADYAVHGRGVLRAIEYQTGTLRWSHDLSGGAGSAGVMTTASGLTFTGDSAGSAIALRTTDGSTLWHSGIGRVGNGPVTYELDGRQYVLLGGGSALYAFALPQ